MSTAEENRAFIRKTVRERQPRLSGILDATAAMLESEVPWPARYDLEAARRGWSDWDGDEPDYPDEPDDLRDYAEERYWREFCIPCGSRPCDWDGTPDGFHTDEAV